MANKRNTLTKIGLLLAFISGILTIIIEAQILLKITIITNLGIGRVNLLSGILGSIISIVCGIILILIYLKRINIDGLMLGIVVLILGLAGGGWIAILGGILIILDYFIN